MLIIICDCRVLYNSSVMTCSSGYLVLPTEEQPSHLPLNTCLTSWMIRLYNMEFRTLRLCTPGNPTGMSESTIYSCRPWVISL